MAFFRCLFLSLGIYFFRSFHMIVFRYFATGFFHYAFPRFFLYVCRSHAFFISFAFLLSLFGYVCLSFFISLLLSSFV